MAGSIAALAKPGPPAAQNRVLNSTAFFVDETGYLLTAGHAVDGCRDAVIVKEGRTFRTRVVARSARVDLALLKSTKTLGLAATFPRSVAAAPNDLVFAGAFDSLEGLSLRGGVLANGRVRAGSAQEGHIVIDAPVSFGASGAPVLDNRGLAQGVVSRRTGANTVLAVSASEAKAFLAGNGVRFLQDDRPQIAGGASRAKRAASISAKLICLSGQK